MNTSDKCGACGTPKSINRFGELDCPKCYSENFVGFPPAVSAKKEVIAVKSKKEEVDIIEDEEDEKIED